MSNRPTHPLKAWRLTQNRWDHAKRESVPLSITKAAAAVGVSYQVWWAWERYADESGSNVPDRANMLKLYRFTNGQVHPNHFYELPDLRAEAAAAAEATLSEPAVHPLSGGSPGRGRSDAAPALHAPAA